MRAPPLGALLGVAAALAAVLLSRRRPDESTDAEVYPTAGIWDYPAAPDDFPELAPVEAPAEHAATGSLYLPALLWMIRRAEHRSADVFAGRDYSLTYGGREFADLSDHPTITGEWMGAPLSDTMCRAAGLRVGCKTTAAGAYQITRPTWDDARRAGSWGPRLPDFSPASQDEAARRILVMSGAMNAAALGDLGATIEKASSRWASLPGSTAQQNPRRLTEVIGFYNEVAG